MIPKGVSHPSTFACSSGLGNSTPAPNHAEFHTASYLVRLQTHQVGKIPYQDILYDEGSFFQMQLYPIDTSQCHR